MELPSSLNRLLDQLEDQDIDPTLTFCLWLRLRAIFKTISFLKSYQPARLMFAFTIALPVTLIAFQPTACQPEPQILTMWGVSLAGMVSLYKLLPG